MKPKKSLLTRLEKVQVDMLCCCECDGRGCTMCIGADVVQEAIEELRQRPELAKEPR